MQAPVGNLWVRDVHVHVHSDKKSDTKRPLLLERWVARAVYYSLHHTVLFNSWQDLADLLMTFDFDTNSKEVLSQNSADVQAIARSWAAVFVDIARLQQPLMGM